MAVEPVQFESDSRQFIALFDRIPLFLHDPPRAILAPEVLPHQVIVGKPQRAMMVVIRRAGMAHARQTAAASASNGKEVRPRYQWREAPTCHLRVAHQKRK